LLEAETPEDVKRSGGELLKETPVLDEQKE
jgi:hypothetical protein